MRPQASWASMAMMTCVVAACGDSAPSVACMAAPASKRGDEDPRIIARVDRCGVSTHSLRFGFALGAPGEQGLPAVIDRLIARELLAQGAQEVGERSLGKAEVEKRIANGELFVLGLRLPADAIYQEGVFDLQAFRQFAGRSGLSVDALVDEQRREMLAQKMRDRLGASAVDAWLAERCGRASKAGRLSVDPDVLARSDDDGKPLPTTYVPCAAWPPTVP